MGGEGFVCPFELPICSMSDAGAETANRCGCGLRGYLHDLDYVFTRDVRDTHIVKPVVFIKIVTEPRTIACFPRSSTHHAELSRATTVKT